MSGLVARAVFYPSLLYNVLLEKLSFRQWYTRIDDTVILGALPFRSMTNQLVFKEKIKGVVTLNEEYETKYLVNSAQEWAALGVQQLRLDTVDLVAAPSQQNLRRGVEFILDHCHQGECVYVHCKAGRTRSATVVACYLMKLHQWTPEKAVDFLTEKRPHVAIRSAQWKALHTYHNENIHR